MKKVIYEQPVVEIIAFTAQDAIASTSVPDQDINEL